MNLFDYESFFNTSSPGGQRQLTAKPIYRFPSPSAWSSSTSIASAQNSGGHGDLLLGDPVELQVLQVAEEIRTMSLTDDQSFSVSDRLSQSLLMPQSLAIEPVPSSSIISRSIPKKGRLQADRGSSSIPLPFWLSFLAVAIIQPEALLHHEIRRLSGTTLGIRKLNNGT